MATTTTISNDKALKFLAMAKHMADTFSKDKEKKVGCIMLDPNTLFIRACGYNGTPLNIKETEERWERPNKRFYIQHAEMNAMCSACRHGTPLNNSICVTTLYPCSSCAKAIIQAGITTIVAPPPDFLHPRWGEEFKISAELFEEAGIYVMHPTEQVSS